MREKPYAKLTNQQKQSQEKKTHISETALDLFSQYGYDQVSVSDIARNSGMSEGSVYHFFGSKAGILSNLVDVVLDDTCEYIAITEEHLRNVRETILTYLLKQGEIFDRLGWELSQKFYAVTQVDSSQTPNFDIPYTATISALNPDLLEFVREAMNQKFLTSRYSPEQIVSTLMIQRYGLVLTWTQCSGHFSLMEASRQTFLMEFDALEI